MSFVAGLKFDFGAWEHLFSRFKGTLARRDRLLAAAYATIGIRDIIDHFAKQEGPDGKWPKRSTVTQAMYAKIASGAVKPPPGYRRGSFSPGNRLLVLTGNMRQSIMPNNWRSVGHSAISVWANSPYSGRHDLGDPRDNLPARTFMWLSSSAQQRMAEFIVRQLEKE